jgi:hypothetical protein
MDFSPDVYDLWPSLDYADLRINALMDSLQTLVIY